MIESLIDWLVGWLAGWLFGWLIDWLIEWMIDWLIGWFVPCKNDKMEKQNKKTLSTFYTNIPKTKIA